MNKKVNLEVAAVPEFFERYLNKDGSVEEVQFEATPAGKTSVHVSNFESKIHTPNGVTQYEFKKPYPSEIEAKRIINEIQTQDN